MAAEKPVEPFGYVFRNLCGKGPWIWMPGKPYPDAEYDWEIKLLWDVAPTPPGYVNIPRSADEAETMLRLSYAYLKQNAPDRLKE